MQCAAPHRTTALRSRTKESFLGVRDELRLVGAVAWTRLPNGALDICRLVVHPVAHRRGVATALLDALDSIEPAELTVVSTGTANLPAVALYRRRGFIPVGERQVAPGVTVTLLERKNASALWFENLATSAPGSSLRTEGRWPRIPVPDRSRPAPGQRVASA
ncbi:GNAT family N-acetyltransferase [Streptomyces sp. NPDC001832]|uniref:GNAT family N-acetyltransferase n=1 Tax=Streptomyces sp. NPDC001832 TaxID=3154527 RepID=UPI0033323F9E